MNFKSWTPGEIWVWEEEERDEKEEEGKEDGGGEGKAEGGEGNRGRGKNEREDPAGLPQSLGRRTPASWLPGAPKDLRLVAGGVGVALPGGLLPRA